ncbi:MATE family efflux transporter [Youxingia wuxianensis]|uniref:Probable multidrug resistance protein NorM n=1 Tax=Youxingia wuxianensis TaxID=2763678 RepID=A0A926EMW0_9FIRM|nr:MATE family efflux transporter [Youxingia wuxianensis]MBC8585521.1 MATE family efflux transporter [Youxingia wuxianensis]
MTTDLTQGPPGRLLWKFSLPLLWSIIFQQLYNIADSVIAGQFVGESALAAIGASYPITMIFIAIATGSNIGCSVVISQLFGAKDYKGMQTAVYTCLISILALSALLTVGGLLACKPMMALLNTPKNIFSDAALYLNIYIGGLIFLFSYNICTGIFTALGDSKTPLYFLIASSLGNIALDLIFVIYFQLGVAGVAWATFLAQGAASVLALITVLQRLKKIEKPLNPKDTEGKSTSFFSLSMLGRIGKIAVPSILQQSFISVGNLAIQGLINTYGSSVIAGYSAAIKLNTFALTSFTTLANGVSSFTAQNIGAGKLERISKGTRAGLVMSLCVAVPFIAVFFGFGHAMMGIFLDASTASPESFAVGEEFLKIVSPFYLVISIKLICDGVLRGSGAMMAFMIGTFADLILRVILSFVLSVPLGESGIWLSWPIGWTIAAVLSGWFYLTGVWKRHVV